MKVKNKNKVPFYEFIFFVIFAIMIVFRLILGEKLEQEVQLINYASMIVAFGGCLMTALSSAKNNREKNICKAISALLLIFFVAIGCIVYFGNIKLSDSLNDIITLLALMFCISDAVFYNFIIKIFSLELNN